MKRHPSKAELMTHAECQVRRMPISAEIARHVNACPVCTREVANMRSSLEFTYKATPLEPSAEMAAQILLAVQRERKALEELRRSRRISPWRALQGIACTALLSIVAGAWFVLLSNPSIFGPATAAGESSRVQLTILEPSPDAVSRTREIQTLAQAVSAPSPNSTVRERTLRRTVGVLQTDVSEALAALERNPGSVRASQVVNAGLRHQAQTLKQLYVERSL